MVPFCQYPHEVCFKLRPETAKHKGHAPGCRISQVLLAHLWVTMDSKRHVPCACV